MINNNLKTSLYLGLESLLLPKLSNQGIHTVGCGSIYYTHSCAIS